MTTKCIYLQQSVSEVMGRQLEIKRPNQNENIVEIQPNRHLGLFMDVISIK